MDWGPEMVCRSEPYLLSPDLNTAGFTGQVRRRR